MKVIEGYESVSNAFFVKIWFEAYGLVWDLDMYKFYIRKFAWKWNEKPNVVEKQIGLFVRNNYFWQRQSIGTTFVHSVTSP